MTPDGLRRAALSAYGRLPGGVRRTLVRWWAPSYTVGALCVVHDDGRLLLVRHTYRKGWSAPGGLLERGEQPERAAVREVLEEVGVEVELAAGPVPIVWPGFRRIDLVYRAGLSPGARPVEAGVRSVELAAVDWFPLDALPDLHGATHEALVRLDLLDP